MSQNTNGRELVQGTAPATSKLTDALFIRDKGPAKIYNLTFENGTQGEFFAGSGVLPFIPGDILSFSLVDSKYPGKPQHIKLNTALIPEPDQDQVHKIHLTIDINLNFKPIQDESNT